MWIQWACSFICRAVTCQSVLTPTPRFKRTMQYCQCLLIVLLMSLRQRVDLACEAQCGPFCPWTPQIGVMVSAESRLPLLSSCCCPCIILQDPWLHLPTTKRRNWYLNIITNTLGQNKDSSNLSQQELPLVQPETECPTHIHFYLSCEKSHWNLSNSVLETWGEMPQLTSSLWLLLSWLLVLLPPITLLLPITANQKLVFLIFVFTCFLQSTTEAALCGMQSPTG